MFLSITNTRDYLIDEQAKSDYSHIDDEDMHFLLLELIIFRNRKKTKDREAHDDSFYNDSREDSSFLMIFTHLSNMLSTTSKNPMI